MIDKIIEKLEELKARENNIIKSEQELAEYRHCLRALKDRLRREGVNSHISYHSKLEKVETDIDDCSLEILLFELETMIRSKTVAAYRGATLT